MRLVTNEKLAELQRDPANIRNVCILAHVDHGKTTLADSLVASNGIISGKLAGTLRYLDSRPDEQQRGITMKSSCIALCHDYDKRDYLINLIDSPGHVDFASEVSTAVRLCDGALVLVDVVEGVCPQTRTGLSILYTEGVKPILVLNKMDRLITEMKLSPLDAYVHLAQVLEQVNAVMGELFASDVMEREEKEEIREDARGEDDWQSALEKADDSSLYFSPEEGNVLFSSAVDGWCFGVGDFAAIYAKTMGFSERVLRKTLWGDFYVNARAKRITRGAQERAKKPLFASLVLESIWSVYETVLVRKDRARMLTMIERMNIRPTTRDMRLTDSRAQLKAICSRWLPLAKSCLDAICRRVPSPASLDGEKIERLISGTGEFSGMPEETRALKKAFLDCSSAEEAPAIAFVSKMFSVERKSLPENRTRLPTMEELRERRERARSLLHAQATTSSENSAASRETSTEKPEEGATEEREDALVAFARVYSGAIVQGQEIFVLGPKHDPRRVLEMRKRGEFPEPPSSLRDLSPGRHVTKVRVSRLYILMGRDLEAIDSVSAGNVCGVGGLEDHVLKTATLSSSLACPAFSELTSLPVPILRVALEPKHSRDLQKLISGLKLLNQADACALVHIQETGEIVLNTAGEVHLERCLEDLKNRYAKVEVNVSEPIVSFRETVVPPPRVDLVNEAIERKADAEAPIEAWTANRQCHLEIDAKPLPEGVTRLLESNADLVRMLDLRWEAGGPAESAEEGKVSPLSERRIKLLEHFRRELQDALEESPGWTGDTLERIWSFGPRKCGSNVLINESDYRRKSVWRRPAPTLEEDPRALYDSSVVNGFQLATLAGPLCEEPMTGVCFVVKRWDFHDAPAPAPDDNSGGSSYSHLGGQLMSAVKEACRRALNQRRPRLVTPMYSCSVLVNSDVLGKLYAVFGRRQGRVIAAESALGFGGHFRVLATLPVPESFQLARELRTQTSGLASPQLVFSHWEVIEQDPYWVPSTEEEYLHFGEKADSGNRAKRYIDAVRRRKGLPVDSQLVTHAEKQRTLSKKK